MFESVIATLDLIASRRALRDLEEWQLKDVGLSRAAADAEAGRPFWDAPAAFRPPPRRGRFVSARMRHCKP